MKRAGYSTGLGDAQWANRIFHRRGRRRTVSLRGVINAILVQTPETLIHIAAVQPMLNRLVGS